jgi:hypothetical protein
MRRSIRVARIFLALLAPLEASAEPPLLRDDEPLPLAREPELARRPVELSPAVTTSLTLCRGGSARDACRAFGPAFGGELGALYRPSPYFAFGGSFGYTRANARVRGRELTRETTALAMVARVYLLEAGAVDPYLEGQVGWAAVPFARAGGGVDLFLGHNVKIGVLAGYSEFGLERGALTGGLALSVLWGESL